MIGGPGAINYPSGSVACVTDKTVEGDAEAITAVAPPGTIVQSGIANWAGVRQTLGGPAANTVGALILSGHGMGAGVQSSTGGLNNTNLDQVTIDVINSRLTAGAPIIIVGCGCGANGNGMQAIADATGHPVIGNTSSVSGGNVGEGQWVQYDPGWFGCGGGF